MTKWRQTVTFIIWFFSIVIDQLFCSLIFGWLARCAEEEGGLSEAGSTGQLRPPLGELAAVLELEAGPHLLLVEAFDDEVAEGLGSERGAEIKHRETPAFFLVMTIGKKAVYWETDVFGKYHQNN
jgi:hypothetical protein